MLFDWLVVGHVLDVNPAHAVRGPKHQVKKGKTPVLTRDEARALIESIAVTRTVKQDGLEQEVPCLTGLRDRALIATMIYTFARVGAVLRMDVGIILSRDAAAGCASMKRAVRNTKHPATTSWKPSSMSTSRPPASQPIRTGRYLEPRGGRPASRNG